MTLGCIQKGRSSSAALNQELKQSLPNVLGNDIYSEGMYSDTKLNPADDPTRGAEIRGPSMSKPIWWDAAAQGDFAQLDQWLHQVGETLPVQWGIPDPAELLGENWDSCQALPRTDGPSEGMIPVPVIPDPCHEPVEHTCAFTVSSDGNQHDFCVRDPDAEQRSCFSPDVTACLRSFKSSHFVWPPRTSPNQPARSWDFSKPGYLDLFSGCRGVAKTVSRIADTWSLCIDIAQDPKLDLLAAELREKLEFLISAKVFFAVGAAPVCGSFSIAVTPAVRDITCPQGKPNISENMQRKVEIGNSFSRWLVRVAVLCLNLDLAFWVENPDRSWLWRQPEWHDLLLDSRTGFWKVTFCSFGAPWKKPTKVLTNTFLKDHVSPCPGCLHHVPLRGFSSKHKKPWTKVAEPYPKRFSGHLGQCIAGYSGLFSSTGRFNVADCAKVTNERIGEASLPGPRARRGQQISS